ncbi:MAG TPA: MFS transporter [Candidatus Dormibacteraeota bacterium]|nr:MFS transporter [Candidatus Dormibacteraeota bacterium]
MRGFGFGFSAVLIGIHLERQGLAPAWIGVTLGIGLASASLMGLASVALAARIGRRPVLALIGLLMAVSGFDLAFSSAPALLVVSGITGMLGASGVDLGPFAPLEQAALTEVTAEKLRNLAFGRYSLTGGIFNAAGGLAATAASASNGRAFFVLYGLLGLLTGALPLFMSARAESELRASLLAPLRDPTRVRLLGGLAALFALDSLAGGFVANAVIAYWLHVRFGASPALLGPFFAAVAILQSVSYEISARLSVRIGLINTMVFTHLPSNVLLLLVAFTPTVGWAIALLLARFLLAQMDVPARQAYVVSIVPASERASALALTGAVRGVAQAAGPPLAGLAIGAAAFGVPFFAGGGLKIVYDLSLFTGFRHRRAMHES